MPPFASLFRIPVFHITNPKISSPRSSFSSVIQGSGCSGYHLLHAAPGVSTYRKAMDLTILFIFMKLYLADYAITVVPIFPSFFPLPSPPNSSGNPHNIVHVHGKYIYILWLLYFLCCTLHPHDYSVTTNWYFLIPSPFSPIPLTPL